MTYKLDISNTPDKRSLSLQTLTNTIIFHILVSVYYKTKVHILFDWLLHSRLVANMSYKRQEQAHRYITIYWSEETMERPGKRLFTATREVCSVWYGRI